MQVLLDVTIHLPSSLQEFNAIIIDKDTIKDTQERRYCITNDAKHYTMKANYGLVI